MDKDEAIRLINGLISEADKVRHDQTFFDAWLHKCQSVLDRVFGKKSAQLQSLTSVNYNFYGISQLGDNTPHIRAFESGLVKAKHVLNSCIWEIQELGLPNAGQADQKPEATIVKEGMVDVLISWSKPQSRAMAELFHAWLPKVVPGFRPWISTKDIDKGKQWFGELQGFLGQATSCIICVTAENVRSPWIYYETGAIAAKKESVLICPYLIGVGTSMVSDGPLSQWQCTLATKDDTLHLIKSMNRALARPHDEGLLTGNFNDKWSEFEPELKRVLSIEAASSADFVESEADVLAGYKLSGEAREILVTAAAGDGRILYVAHDGGPTIQVGTTPMNNPADRRSTTKFEAAFHELSKNHLIMQRGRGLAEVTAKGYEVADALAAPSNEA
jgi:hypothetical protein